MPRHEGNVGHRLRLKMGKAKTSTEFGIQTSPNLVSKRVCSNNLYISNAFEIMAQPKIQVRIDGMEAKHPRNLNGIELKDAIPTSMKGQFDDWAFGCDTCQDVCPWNRFSKPHSESQFNPHSDMLDMTKQDWEELTEDVFKKVFQKSAVKRTKFAGLKRNIEFLKK